MKKGFTIVEVSILFVIFLVVFLLIAPLSFNDTIQAKNTSRWKNVQGDFTNIFYAVNNYRKENDADLQTALDKILSNDIKSSIKPYRITFLNGSSVTDKFKFEDFKTTYLNATVAYKLFNEPQKEIKGILMYDVNGKQGPNVWGKDVFGLSIYDNKFEPYCRFDPVNDQKRNCSRTGTGVCCSNYYLIGGSFD